MRTLRYGVAATLDGFIAGPNGEYDWIPQDPDIDFAAMFAAVDTLLMGRVTYEVIRSQEPGMLPADKGVYVVSRTLDPAAHPGVTVISEDVPGAVRQLKEGPGKDIWLFGGGVLFAVLLAAGLVDEVEVAVVPFLLGGGIPLLPPTGVRARLELLHERRYPKSGIVLLRYGVRS
jgi:dihydrofolate reductase